MMKQISVHVPDECILERVVPYVVSQARPRMSGCMGLEGRERGGAERMRIRGGWG